MRSQPSRIQKFRHSDRNFPERAFRRLAVISDIHHPAPENYLSSSVMLMVAATDSAPFTAIRPDFLIGNLSQGHGSGRAPQDFVNHISA
jgi:hypothetical protein